MVGQVSYARADACFEEVVHGALARSSQPLFSHRSDFVRGARRVRNELACVSVLVQNRSCECVLVCVCECVIYHICMYVAFVYVNLK